MLQKMTHHGRILTLAADESGAVLVIVALFAPVLILFAAFAIDAGSWFLHARHLQVQADAGALAAAQEFQPCLNPNIYGSAGQYGGASSVTTPSGNVTSTTPLYNPPISGTSQSNLHEVINSKTYYNQVSPVDSTAEAKPPCEADMVDVKLTETNLPWYWRTFSTVPYINAHARVELQQVTSATGVEPLAVAETAPVAAAAYFVDEDNGNAILKKTSLSDLGPNGEGQDVWSNSSVPVELAITHRHIGVVIALSGNKGDTTCGDATVECFGRKTETEKALLTSAEPLLHVAGYSSAGSGTLAAPLARQVTLSNPLPDTCTDGYFSNSASSCTFMVSAKVDYASANRTGVSVTPIVGGKTAPSAMTFNTSSGLWTGTATLPTGSGSNAISLLVKCEKKTTSPCPTASTEATIKETINGTSVTAVVQRAYAASSAHSGTIKGAWISEVGGLPQDANSYEVCEPQDGNSCTHRLVATVDVGGSIGNAAGYSDPLRQLKFEGNQGVIAECPPAGPEEAGEAASEYRAHLAKGCPGRYTINTADPNCTGTTEPFDCLKVGIHGKKTGALMGIGERIEDKPGTTFACPNNWQNNNNGGVPLIPKNDPRVVEVFIMPYGSVNSQGQAVLPSGRVPIQDFAAFYVTGFPGDSCKSDPKTGNAEIVGHFIKYITIVNGGGEQKCTLNSLGECVAVLTR
jgi:Putative Flp pilus-assembly TadE/G-like